jgi:hypothetical protein
MHQGEDDMGFLSWCELLVLEQRLSLGPFGKYNRYRCWCLKRNARTTEEKLRIAREVLNGPGVTTLEAQYNELYIQRHEKRKGEVPPLGELVTTLDESQPMPSKQT